LDVVSQDYLTIYYINRSSIPR